MESNRAEPTSPSTYLMNPKSSPSTFLSGVVAACFLSSCATNPLGADRFAAADTNNDDHLSRKEASDAAIRGIMKDFDGNRDGRLTYAEWEKSDPAADPDLFARRDTDNDGFVTLAEAQASADRQQFLSPFIRKADLDGDGLVSRSEAAEYAARNAATKN